jgi:peptide/nickel transport system permease protein
VVPGDAIMIRISEAGTLSPERLEAARADLGIDKPVYEQYLTWLGRAAIGDFGESFWARQDVLARLWSRMPATFELLAMALFLAVIFGIPVGVLSATRQNSITDYTVRVVSVVWLAVPNFWIGALMLLVPAVLWGWTPARSYVSLFDNPTENLLLFIFPAVALGLRLSAIIARFMRSSLLEVLRQDYVRTARAKGLHERRVVYLHGLRNSLIPVVTIIGLQSASLIGGTVIIEQVFSIPGVGRQTLDSIYMRDYTQLQANVFFIAVAVLLVNLIVDLSYGFLDPRIRYN